MSWHSSKSMKAWRTQENRRLRHNAKQIINICEDYDALIIPVLNDYDTLWGSPQDGKKHYVEKPLVNQCQIDSQSWDYRNKWLTKPRKLLGNEEHYVGRKCYCYSNKLSYYWKNLRK